MTGKVLVKYDLKFRELFDCSIYVLLTGKILKRYFLYLLALAVLSEVLGFLSAPKYKLTWETIMPIAVSFAGLFILFCVFVFIGSLFVYKKYPANFKDGTYEFTHWGMIKMVNGKEFSKPWRDFLKVKETKQFFLFYISSYDAHIVQKRMFENADDINALRSLINEKVEKLTG